MAHGLVLIALPEYENSGTKIEYKFEAETGLSEKIEYFDNRGLTIPE
ncbi:MAG: hypothetical protein JXD23_13905 [Spirochaetales bacterium]|nr:hypothetical protein [Spirochaetales bacterium]